MCIHYNELSTVTGWHYKGCSWTVGHWNRIYKVARWYCDGISSTVWRYSYITEFPEPLPLDDIVIELTGLFDTETEFTVFLHEIVMELLLHCS